jgi:4-hydroxythreonine-4-phosphate dehydrogenase
MPLSPLIAITQGDAAGIGAEIIVQAFLQRPESLQGCFVVGDVATLRRACHLFVRPGHPPIPVAVINHPLETNHIPSRCIPLLALDDPPDLAAFGQVQATAGAFAGRCIQWAARAALRGQIQALVTAPIHKEALAAAGGPWNQYPGHTEMLQAATAEHLHCRAQDVPVRMMLANRELRTVLVSIHVALRDAIAQLSTASILETIHIAHRALQAVLPQAPRIAVAGLNPHAGEGGRFGQEEIDIIIPAIHAAQQQGVLVSGPYSPDTIFMRARQTTTHAPEFDTVIAMYHDQGLIPIKYMGMEQGVNITLGLPFIRTSPDHGTAFDIAGQGIADPSSMLEAIEIARQLINQRHAVGT